LLGGNIAGGSPNITLSQAGNITATGNLSVTGTTSLNNFVYGNTINSRLFIADTISLSSNKEIEFNDVNVKIARESTSVTQLNFDILSTTQASVRNGRVVIGDDKISLTTGGAITAAANVISKNNNAYVELAPGANTSFRTYDESGNVNVTMGWDGSITAAGRVDVGALTVDSNLTPTSGTSIEHFYTTNGGIIQAYDRTNNNLEPLQVRGSTWALALDGSATFAGALEAESIDGGTY